MVRATHGKRVDNWGMPPDTPESVRQAIFQQLADESDEVCQTVKRRRRRSDTPAMDDTEPYFGALRETDTVYDGDD